MNIIERNNVKIIGNGDQTIVLAHGLGCDQQMWGHLTEALKEQYRLVLFDHVGSGRSLLAAYDSKKYNTLQGYADDLIEVIEAVGGEEVIYIGHSIGSMMGLIAAIARPELFNKIVMVGPSPCYLNDGDYKGGFERADILELLDMMEMNFTGWASYMAPLVIDYSEQPSLKVELEEVFASANPIVAREFAEVTFFSDYRSRLSELQTPTLILQCSEDSIVPIEVGQYLNNLIPNSELAIMAAKGHYPHISQPKETLELIEGYLNSVLTKHE